MTDGSDNQISHDAEAQGSALSGAFGSLDVESTESGAPVSRARRARPFAASTLLSVLIHGGLVVSGFASLTAALVAPTQNLAFELPAEAAPRAATLYLPGDDTPTRPSTATFELEAPTSAADEPVVVEAASPAPAPAPAPVAQVNAQAAPPTPPEPVEPVIQAPEEAPVAEAEPRVEAVATVAALAPTNIHVAPEAQGSIAAARVTSGASATTDQPTHQGAAAAAAVEAQGTTARQASHGTSDAGRPTELIRAHRGRLSRAMAGRRQCPREATRARLHGTAHVEIKQDLRGNIIEARVVRSSGSAALDDAALAQAQGRGRLPAPPDDVLAYGFVVPFVFNC